VAVAAERRRRRELEEGFNGLRKRVHPKLLSVAAEEWLAMKRHVLAPRSVLIERTNLGHLLPEIGKLLISDIGSDDIGHYQQKRLRQGASPKTVNLEIGTIRAILRRNKVWESVREDVRMLPTRSDFGRALNIDEERTLLAACAKSRSRILYPVVVLARNTGMRSSEVRLLRWNQIDLIKREVTVGKSKTDFGTGRVIPLNDTAFSALQLWASQFPDKEAEHFVFPKERYGASGDVFDACTYKTDLTKPIGSFKKSWQAAKKEAGVHCRFHDLRHTACTRMLEAGKPFSVVASVMGWSPATTVLMSKRYGHMGQVAQREAVDAICKLDYRPHESGEKIAKEPSKLVN